MYYYADMPFDSLTDAIEHLGTIKMCFIGRNRLGTAADGTDLRVRGYVFMSEDLEKLNNIINAADGSRAVAADTGYTYLLCNGEWRVWKSKGGSGGDDDSPGEWEDLDEPDNPSGSGSDDPISSSEWEGI